MSRFPRPRTGEVPAYHQDYVDRVPAEVTDILRHLKYQGQEVLALLRGLDDATAERRYAPGKWSIKELIGHLIDTERVFIFRALWFARGDGQPQPAMDEDAWAAASNAGSRPLAALWREQHVARTDGLYVLKSLDAAAAGRAGASGGHRLTVAAIPWIIAGHERHHLDVLRDRYGIVW